MNISLMFLFSISSQLIFFSDLKYASIKGRCQELTDYADLSCGSFCRFYNYKAQSYSLDACTTHVRPWELCVSRAAANDKFWYSR